MARIELTEKPAYVGHLRSVRWDAPSRSHAIRAPDRGRKVMPNDEAEVDRSDEADARRFRWLLNGRGYFMEEEYLCGGALSSCCQSEQDRARRVIDEAMHAEEECERSST